MGISNNSPTMSYVHISGASVVWNNETYMIQDFATNKKYIYWNADLPNQLNASNVMPNRSAKQYLVILNDNGMSTLVPSTSDDFNISFDSSNNQNQVLKEKIFGLYEKNEKFDEKFVAIEEDINGLRKAVGSGGVGGTGYDDTEVWRKISEIEQTAGEIDLSVKETIKTYNDDKESNKLREDLNTSFIKINSTIGDFKSEATKYFKDNEISNDEKIQIEKYLEQLEGEKINVDENVDKVILIARNNNQTQDVVALSSAKSALQIAHDNLRNNITNVIIDSIVTPTENTVIINAFASYNLRLNELKNTCDDIILLGLGGTLVEELGKISVKSDEIKLSVSKVETTTKALNTDLEATNNKIDGVKFGSNNLFRYSDFKKENVLNKWYCYNANTLTIWVYENFGKNLPSDAHIKGKKILRSRINVDQAISEGVSYGGFNLTTNERVVILEPNTEYTFSYWVYKSGVCKSTHASIWTLPSDGISTIVGKTASVTEYTGSFVRCSITFTTTDVTDYYVRFYNYIDETKTGQNSDVHIYQPTLTKGNKVVDWTPCSLDLDDDINTLNSTVTSTNKKVSTIEANLSDITSRVSTAETTSLTNFNNLLVNSNIKNSTDGWRLTNLVKGKSLVNAITTSTIPHDRHTFLIGDNSDNTAQTRIMDSTKFAVNQGEKISLNFCALTNDYLDSLQVYILFTDNNKPIEEDNSYLQGYQYVSVPSGTGWKKYTLTSDVPTGATRGFIRIRYVSKVKPTASDQNRCSLASIMVNRGDKYPTWTSNTEDNYFYHESRLKYAEQKITDEAITSTVGKSFYTKTDIDGKGYQNSSQVQQLVDKLEMKFQESGGYNLLYNGNFKRGTDKWNISSNVTTETGNGNYSSPDNCGLCITGKSGSTGYVSQNISSEHFDSVRYTLSGYVYISSTGTDDVSGASFNYYVRLKYSDETYTYHRCTWDKTNYNKWLLTSFSFSRDKSKTLTEIRVTLSIENSTRKIYLSQAMLETGNSYSGWSPNPNEVYDGVTTIDKDGIKVSQSNYNGYTQMKTDGFYVNNGSENVISVTSSGATFKGKVTVTGGSIPTSSLSGTIASSQLNTAITSDISTAKTNASTALNTANTVNSIVTQNKDAWSNAHKIVEQWAYDATDDSVTIDGGLIEANTIIANKLAIGDFNNYATVNEYIEGSMLPSIFKFGGTEIRKGTNQCITSTSSTKQYLMLSDFTRTNFRHDDEIYVEGYLYSHHTEARNISINVWGYDSDKIVVSGAGASFTVNVPSKSWTKVKGTIKLSNTSWGTNSIVYHLVGLNMGTDATISQSINIWARGFSFRRKSTGDLIVDGSITANKIAADAITANMITSGTLDVGKVNIKSTSTKKIVIADDNYCVYDGTEVDTNRKVFVGFRTNTAQNVPSVMLGYNGINPSVDGAVVSGGTYTTYSHYPNNENPESINQSYGALAFKYGADVTNFSTLNMYQNGEVDIKAGGKIQFRPSLKNRDNATFVISNTENLSKTPFRCNSAIYGANKITLARGSLYIPNFGTNATMDYLRMGGGHLACTDEGVFHIIPDKSTRSIAFGSGTIYLPQGGGDNISEFARFGMGVMAVPSNGSFHFVNKDGASSPLYAKNMMATYSLESAAVVSEKSVFDRINSLNVVDTSEGLRISKTSRNLEDNDIISVTYNEKTLQEEVSINYNSTISTLLKAAQELKQENEELKRNNEIYTEANSILQEKVSTLENNMTNYTIIHNRLLLASMYSADSVTFKVDYFTREVVDSYDEDLFNLILSNILVGKENYNYDKMFNLILDYASWSKISWEQFDMLIETIDLQHNPPVEESTVE